MANSLTTHRLDIPKTNGVAALMYYAIAHIHIEDAEIKPIKFRWEEFAELVPMTMRAIKAAVERAGSTNIRFIRVTEDKFTTLPIFDEIVWDRGEITLCVNKKLTPYLIGLHELFTTARLVDLLRIEGPAMRNLFWYITAQHNSCRVRRIPHEDMYDMLNLSTKHTRYPSFIQKTIQELNEASVGLRVKYDTKSEELSWKRLARKSETT